MELDLPLDKMTITDKLQALEQIWDDLCRTPEKIPSPGWHKEVLQAREDRMKQGDAQLTDWPEAKEKIRTSVK